VDIHSKKTDRGGDDDDSGHDCILTTQHRLTIHE